MKQIVIRRKKNGIYWWEDQDETKHSHLMYLFDFLTDPQAWYLACEELDQNPNTFMIYNRSDIKNGLRPENFDSYKAYGEYLARLKVYAKKRVQQMPKIIIIKKKLDELKQQIHEIEQQRHPQYLILQQDDDGNVTIIEKNELSPEDVATAKRDHKIYLNYVKRINAYYFAHPEKFSKVWLSEADNYFDEDCPLYDPIDEQGVDDE